MNTNATVTHPNTNEYCGVFHHNSNQTWAFQQNFHVNYIKNCIGFMVFDYCHKDCMSDFIFFNVQKGQSISPSKYGFLSFVDQQTLYSLTFLLTLPPLKKKKKTEFP